MSGRKALKAIWSMKWLAIATLLVVLGVSAGVTALLPKVYQATATVRVIPAEQPADTFSQLQTNQALARTYAELLKSPNIYRAAVDREEIPLTAEVLMESTTVSYVEGTELIQVQVEALDPDDASSWANAVVQTFVEEQEGMGGERLVVADPAPVPTEPVSPSWPINMALALVLGAGVAVGGVLLLSFLSDRLSSPEEIEELIGAPFLGSLPVIKPSKKDDVPKRLGTTASYEEAAQEAARTLRVNLSFALGDGIGNGVVLVTSASHGEGKTTVSIYLAEAYARAGRRCLLVDADLRMPHIHSRWRIRNPRGFSNLLMEGPGTLHDTLIKIKEISGLAVLTSGPVPPNSVDLLSLGKTEGLIRDLRERFDSVILDSPPALAFADASILGGLADGTILVVDGQRARRRSLLRTVDQLRSGGTRILGFVLNRAPAEETALYSSYSYGYGR